MVAGLGFLLGIFPSLSRFPFQTGAKGKRPALEGTERKIIVSKT